MTFMQMTMTTSFISKTINGVEASLNSGEDSFQTSTYLLQGSIEMFQAMSLGPQCIQKDMNSVIHKNESNSL